MKESEKYELQVSVDVDTEMLVFKEERHRDFKLPAELLYFFA